MQADLRAGIRAGGWRASATIGVISNSSYASIAGPVVSREHWVGYALDGDTYTVRAGRINLPYGLRIIEHDAWVRAETRTDINDEQQHGVAFAYTSQLIRAEAMGILGKLPDQPRCVPGARLQRLRRGDPSPGVRHRPEQPGDARREGSRAERGQYSTGARSLRAGSTLGTSGVARRSRSHDPGSHWRTARHRSRHVPASRCRAPAGPPLCGRHRSNEPGTATDIQDPQLGCQIGGGGMGRGALAGSAILLMSLIRRRPR